MNLLLNKKTVRPNDEYQLLTNDLQYIHDKFINIKGRKESQDPDLKDWLGGSSGLGFNKWMCFEQDQVNGLSTIEQLQTELSSHATDKSWISQTRNHICKKHDWLFKKFKNKTEAETYLDLPKNKDRFKYIDRVWQNN